MKLRQIVTPLLLCALISNNTCIQAKPANIPSLSKWEWLKTTLITHICYGLAGIGIGAGTGALVSAGLNAVNATQEELPLLPFTVYGATLGLKLSEIFSAYVISNHFYQKGLNESEEQIFN